MRTNLITRPVFVVLGMSVLCCGLPGCRGTDEGQLITGTVSFRGQVVPRGIINFIGPDKVPLGGPIGPDGTYECRLAPGQYTVIVSAPALPEGDWKDGDPPPEGPPAVPAKYGRPQTSGLSARVGDQDKTIDFPL